MTSKALAENFIIALPYFMAAVFCLGVIGRLVVWYTVRRHEWFAHEFEKRVNRYLDHEKPGQTTGISFYVLTKRTLERTFYEVFAVRERLRRRRGDGVLSFSDRVFLIKPGCAWLVRDILNQLKFLKWTKDTPKLQHIVKATLHYNPCFNRAFGIIPIGGLNDVISILPGLFVVAGILGTFIGIAGGLQELGGMNLQDLDNTKNIMDRFLQEIAFAMKTSITGIVFSLAAHVINTVFSPDRVFVEMIDRFESALDLLWYRSENNEFPQDEKAFNEHLDPIEALAQDAVNLETKRYPDRRDLPESAPPKAS